MKTLLRQTIIAAALGSAMAASAQYTNPPSSTPANPEIPPQTTSPSYGTDNSASNHDNYWACLFVLGGAEAGCLRSPRKNEEGRREGHDRLDGRQRWELVIRQRHIDGHGNERRDHRWDERDRRNFQRRRWRGKQTVIDALKRQAGPRSLNALR